MLQSLLTLEDDQIDIVLDTVKRWCEANDVKIDSPEDSRAVSIAVNVLTTQPFDDLYLEINRQLQMH